MPTRNNYDKEVGDVEANTNQDEVVTLSNYHSNLDLGMSGKSNLPVSEWPSN
jgi:hypothetical protein